VVDTRPRFSERVGAVAQGAEDSSEASERRHKMPKLIQIAPVVVPGVGQATDVVVWALDNDGALWKKKE
jgi:hypothetical protein